MLAVVKRLSREWQALKAFNALPRRERKIVFYAEDGGYWTYLEPVFIALQRECSEPILYVTSCEQDPLLTEAPKGLLTFYIGEGSMRTFFFAGLDADVLVMTMPDLQTFHIKRSPHSVKYVYLHHSLVSTHMVYRPAAFDHFDVILCVGPHHEKEIRAREALQGLPHKQLVQHGYGRLDSILSEGVQGPIYRDQSEPISVLVAPTWGEQGLLESHAHELVNLLLSAGFRVIVRPHPRTIKLKPDMIRDLVDAFGSHDLFVFDDQPNARVSLLQADIMISDWSGAALEFAMGLERPVLFIDVPKKILNPEYRSLDCEILESSIRKELGVILKPEELHKSPAVLRDMFNNRSSWQNASRTARKRWVFNEGRSGRVAANFLTTLIHQN